jgi:hypothetical protein
VDHHCHPVSPWRASISPLELRACLTEALDVRVLEEHVPASAGYRLAIRVLASELGCEATEEAVLAARSALGPDDLMRRTGTELLLLDLGYGDTSTLGGLPVRWREVMRLETVAESLAPELATAQEWLDAIRAAVRSTQAVAVKTIVAYRASLRLQEPDMADVDEAYAALRDSNVPRVTGNALCHTLVLAAGEECVARGLPLQVHCGLGDPDEDLAEASPLGLRPFFTQPRFAGLSVVMLHCYPYHREAAYLCSVFPGAYMDLSLSIPLAGVDGLQAMHEVLGLCPWSKLLYATDASRLPEMFLVAARLQRRGLAGALGGLVDAGALTLQEADQAGRQVLSENARRLYRL